MPAILERVVKQLKAKGKSTAQAFAIGTAAMQKAGNLKKGTQTATAKGTKRGAMTPAQRSADRAAKKSGRKPSDFKYKATNNTSILKKQ